MTTARKTCLAMGCAWALLGFATDALAQAPWCDTGVAPPEELADRRESPLSVLVGRIYEEAQVPGRARVIAEGDDRAR